MKQFLKLALLTFVYSAMAFDLEDYATTYRATRDAYLKAANELKLATGPYKAARDAYVAATATYTKSLYERRRLGEIDDNLHYLKVLQTAYKNTESSEAATNTANSIYELLDTFHKGRKLFDLEDYATTYRATRDAYLKAANELKLATGPYKAARDAYVAATATYTKSLYERRRLGKKNLLGKKVADKRAFHKLLSQTNGLTIDDLEELSFSPGKLFTNMLTREKNTNEMTFDELENLAENPKSIFDAEKLLLQTTAVRRLDETSLEASNPKHGFEISFKTNEDNSVGDGANKRWKDIMYNHGDARDIPEENYDDEISNVAYKGWFPTLATSTEKNDQYQKVYDTALGHSSKSDTTNPSPGWVPNFN